MWQRRLWVPANTLIFDAETYHLLAEEEVLLQRGEWLDAQPPVVIGWNTYLASGFVPSTASTP